jgi:hypothetical protein
MLRPAYNRHNDRDNYRNKRSSNNEDQHNRDRRDDGIIKNFIKNFK